MLTAGVLVVPELLACEANANLCFNAPNLHMQMKDGIYCLPVCFSVN